jgi:molybdopterin molybdotransferase
VTTGLLIAAAFAFFILSRSTPMGEMILPEKAQSILFDLATPLPPITIPIINGLDYITAEDVCAAYDIPPFTNSAMDGFAVHSPDTAGATPDSPARLHILETVAAGDMPACPVRSGSCTQIMTGAAMPDGADSVVMVEKTRIENGYVLIFEEASSGINVREAGEDVRKGTTLVEKGTALTPPAIGLLAATGVERISVYPRPKTGILITGNELVQPGTPLSPGKIYNSNGCILFALVRETGAIPVEFGVVEDSREGLQFVMEEALSKCDVVISSGGVSAGKFDYVEDVLRGIGSEILFTSVKQKPGKPMVGAIRGVKPYFGLPGNPVSAMVCFELYARPFLRKMMGWSRYLKSWTKGFFIEPYHHTGSRFEWVRVRIAEKDGRNLLDPYPSQGSGIISSMTSADGLARVDADARIVTPDDEIDVYMLR